MRRSELSWRWRVVALMTVSWSALARPASAQDAARDPGDGACDLAVGFFDAACDSAAGAIGSGVERVVVSGARAALSEVVEFVVGGAAWLLGRLVDVIETSTTPQVTAGWFQASYADMAAIAGLAILPFLLLSLVQAVVRQDPGQAMRAAFVHIPIAAIGTAAAVVVVDLLVTLTDGLSAFIGRNLGADLTEFATGLGTAVGGLSAATAQPAVAGLAAVLGAGAVAFGAFVVWLELLLRQAAIYVAVLFLPLGFMALVWPATAHWLRRLIEGLVALILSKFVIVAVLALAANALDAQVTTEGFGVVLAGGALLLLAAFAPYVLLRFIPVFEAGVASQFEGTLRRPTAAAPLPTRGSVYQQIMSSRLGSGGAQVGSAPGGVGASSGAARATGSVPARGATAGAGVGAATAGGSLIGAGVGAAAAGVGGVERVGDVIGRRFDRTGPSSVDGPDSEQSPSPPTGGGDRTPDRPAEPPPPTPSFSHQDTTMPHEGESLRGPGTGERP